MADYPIYDRNFFKTFFEVDDSNVLAWTNNVLDKIYNLGIIPEYVTREGNIEEDKDFIDLFETTAHLFAIIVEYARRFEKISENEILLINFINQVGLFTNSNITTTHLQYLFDNYSDEFRKRGTSDIVKFNDSINIPNGEMLRLISYNDPDEFIFAHLEPHATGWCLSKSSPTFNYTRHCINIIKGYEKLDGFEDLTKYPLNPTSGSFSIVNKALNVSSVTLNTKVGIDSTTFNATKAIPINSLRDYEIVLDIEIASTDSVLYFGARGFDINGDVVEFIELDGETTSDYFFEAQRLPRSNNRYFVNGMILGFASDDRIKDTSDVNLDIGYGSHLKINNEDMKYIIPFVYLLNPSGATPTAIIYDFKIRPLKFNFTLGKLGLKNIIYSGYFNSSIYTNNKVYNNIVNYLLPYNVNFINNNYNNNWILIGGFWDDEGIWDDDDYWRD